VLDSKRQREREDNERFRQQRDANAVMQTGHSAQAAPEPAPPPLASTPTAAIELLDIAGNGSGDATMPPQARPGSLRQSAAPRSGGAG
jgi:hypothetical protein